MLHKLAIKHLPYPRALREGVQKGDVAIEFTSDGTIVYSIYPACSNVVEVRKSIALRMRWELIFAGAEGALFVITALAAAAILTQINFG